MLNPVDSIWSMQLLKFFAAVCYEQFIQLILSLNARSAIKFLLKAVPAIDVVILQGCFIGREGRQVLRKSRLEHERHGVIELL